MATRGDAKGLADKLYSHVSQTSLSVKYPNLEKTIADAQSSLQNPGAANTQDWTAVWKSMVREYEKLPHADKLAGADEIIEGARSSFSWAS